MLNILSIHLLLKGKKSQLRVVDIENTSTKYFNYVHGKKSQLRAVDIENTKKTKYFNYVHTCTCK